MAEQEPHNPIPRLSELRETTADKPGRFRQQRAQSLAVLARARARHRVGIRPPLGDYVLYRHGHGPTTLPVTD